MTRGDDNTTRVVTLYSGGIKEKVVTTGVATSAPDTFSSQAIEAVR